MTAKTASKKTDEMSAPASAPATPVASAPQPVQVRVFRTKTADLTFPEERVKLVTLPAELLLEADPATVAKWKGHQIDPSRPASHIGVMPNLDLLAATKNPYPNDPAHPTVVTADAWRPYIAVAYHTFEVLKEKGEVAPSNIYAEVQKRIGGERLTYIEPAVRDALRDLACVGLAEVFVLKRKKSYRLKVA